MRSRLIAVAACVLLLATMACDDSSDSNNGATSATNNGATSATNNGATSATNSGATSATNGATATSNNASSAPCLRLTAEDAGETFAFGLTAIGAVRQRRLTLSSCAATAPLNITALALSEDTHPAFSLEHDGDLPIQLSAADSVVVVVSYAPPDEAAHSGTLVIESDDARSAVTLPLAGEGVTRSCPTAIARGRAGLGALSNRVDARVGNTVLLDGAGSFSLDDPITTYAWSIVEAPVDSNARVESDVDLPNATFVPDVAGTYVVRLHVETAFLPGCEDAQVTINAQAGGIVLEVVWDTPGDPDQANTGAGAGADVDLQLLHPNGTWNTAPWACFWNNVEPNWGDSASQDDNPVLSGDDDGAGPEYITLDVPEDVVYRVGVNYFNANNYGPSFVTLRLVLEDELVYEYAGKELQQGDFWEVIAIDWGNKTVEEVDALITP